MRMAEERIKAAERRMKEVKEAKKRASLAAAAAAAAAATAEAAEAEAAVAEAEVAEEQRTAALKRKTPNETQKPQKRNRSDGWEEDEETEPAQRALGYSRRMPRPSPSEHECVRARDYERVRAHALQEAEDEEEMRAIRKRRAVRLACLDAGF